MSENEHPSYRREQHEPEELHTAIPPWLVVVFAAIVGWGLWYYFQHSGFPLQAGDSRTAIVVDPSAAVDGGAVYAGNCASCHQATGEGLPGVFPPLAAAEWAIAGDKAIPVQILLHGLNGAITVKGASYSGQMPAFNQLSDAEIAAVLSHVRSSWGNEAGAITAEDVAAGRKVFPDRTTAWQGEVELKAEVGSP
jgi:mono/diheme cytochrome c family protein